MQRGEIWWATLPDPVASEPGYAPGTGGLQIHALHLTELDPAGVGDILLRTQQVVHRAFERIASGGPLTALWASGRGAQTHDRKKMKKRISQIG